MPVDASKLLETLDRYAEARSVCAFDEIDTHTADDARALIRALQAENMQFRAGLDVRTRERDALHSALAETKARYEEQCELTREMRVNVDVYRDELAATKAELEEARRERDAAQSCTPVVSEDVFAAVRASDAIIQALRAKSSALDRLEEWLRGADWRFVEASMVVGEGEITVSLEQDNELHDDADVHAKVADDNLTKAITAALDAAREKETKA